jgi:hypothetical protein
MVMTNEYAYDIFLSYSSYDRAWTKQLAAAIEADRDGEHLTVFLDEADIPPGSNIPLALDAALRSTRHIGLVLSPEALASPWVSLEWSTALMQDPTNRKGRLIPLLRKPCDLPPFLGQLKHVDFRDDRDFGVALKTIIDVLRGRPLSRMADPLTEVPVHVADFERIDPFELLTLSKELFHRSNFEAALELNRFVYKKLDQSRTEEGRRHAIKAGTYMAINLRILGRTNEAIKTLDCLDSIEESKDSSFRAEIQRLRGSILFERGVTEGSAQPLAEATRLFYQTETDARRLILSVWRNAWIAYLHPNTAELFGYRDYRGILDELRHLLTCIENGSWATNIDRNFAKTIWVKTKSGILIAEGETKQAQRLVEPIIVEWSQLEDPTTTYYQPSMIVDFFRELSYIHLIRCHSDLARRFSIKAQALAKQQPMAYFPFFPPKLQAGSTI